MVVGESRHECWRDKMCYLSPSHSTRVAGWLTQPPSMLVLAGCWIARPKRRREMHARDRRCRANRSRLCEGDRTPSIALVGVYVLTNKLLLTIYYKVNWKACIDLLVTNRERDADVRTHVTLAGI